MAFTSFLLIDDDPDDHEIFISALQQASACAKCIAFCDPLKAIEEMANGNVQFDIVFVDLNMPKIDGLEFLRITKDMHALKGIPIYMYTTSSDVHARDTALILGASDFVTKSASMNELIELLSAITGK